MNLYLLPSLSPPTSYLGKKFSNKKSSSSLSHSLENDFHILHNFKTATLNTNSNPFFHLCKIDLTTDFSNQASKSKSSFAVKKII